jgi:hypothetical protein
MGTSSLFPRKNGTFHCKNVARDGSCLFRGLRCYWKIITKVHRGRKLTGKFIIATENSDHIYHINVADIIWEKAQLEVRETTRSVWSSFEKIIFSINNLCWNGKAKTLNLVTRNGALLSALKLFVLLHGYHGFNWRNTAQVTSLLLNYSEQSSFLEKRST